MKEKESVTTTTRTKRKVSIIGVKNRVLCHASTLSPAARLVAIALSDYFREDPSEVFPAVSTIGSLCGMKERAARDAIHELEFAGIITILEGSLSGTRRSNTYDFTPLDLGRKCRGGSSCECDHRGEDATRTARRATPPKRIVRRGHGGRFAGSTSAESAEVGSHDLGTERGRPRHETHRDLGTNPEATSAKSADEPVTEKLQEAAGEAGEANGAAAAPSLTTNGNGSSEGNEARPNSQSEDSVPTNVGSNAISTAVVEEVTAHYAKAFSLANETNVRATPGLKEAVRAALEAGYTREEVIAVAVLSWLDENDFYRSQNPALPLRFTGPKNHMDELLAKLWFGMRVPPHVIKVSMKVGEECAGLVAYFKSRVTKPTVIPFAPKAASS